MTTLEAAGPAGRPTPRRAVSRRTSNKEAAVLSSARELFCQRGFAATSIEAIAAVAQVSKQTVYTYFTTKDRLLEHVLKEFVDTGTKAWRAQYRDELPITGVEQLRAELRVLLTAVVRTLMNPDYLAIVRVIIAEAARRPELGTLFRQSIADAMLAAVRGVLSRVVPELRAGVKPELGARLVIGSVLPYVLLDGLLRPDRPQPPAPHQIDEVADVLAVMLCRP
ncbi:MAG TPA: TetR/AcrR family transcriptional regulator [Jatrophihabitans sp.]|uniref:TetR/AcrR family transcriptional regulator n=1 Tax=Jatrophihabitans sp. TaxID=1932789 RepID=UPI002F22AE86